MAGRRADVRLMNFIRDALSSIRKANSLLIQTLAKRGRPQPLARIQHDVYDRLSEIGNPVLICGGRYDQIAPIANQKGLLSQLPNAELKLFEGGHGFYREDPRAYQRIIPFLQGRA